VTHLDSVVKLNNLCDENFSRLQIKVITRIVERFEKTTIISLGLRNAWEKIKHDVFEKRKIILQEFWNVYISQGS
jgi:hypothetical protein